LREVQGVVGKIGKLTLDEFHRYIAGRLGAPNRRALVPPQAGVDAGVIDVGDGNVLVVAEDPIFPAPGLPLAEWSKHGSGGIWDQTAACRSWY
jgi:hydrogenase maturation factor